MDVNLLDAGCLPDSISCYLNAAMCHWPLTTDCVDFVRLITALVSTLVELERRDDWTYLYEDYRGCHYWN